MIRERMIGMKQSGFTLVEIISVIAIMAVLLLISYPAFLFIRNRVLESSYRNKVELVLSAAEQFASDTTYDVVNVEHLISEGRLEPDNEAGDFVNPLTKDSMLCDVVRIDVVDSQYVGRYTDEKNCDFNDLISKNSIIEFKKYRSDGTEITKDEWIMGDVVLRVVFKDEKFNSLATSLKIVGNGEVKEEEIHNDFQEKNSVTVSASQLLMTSYEAHVSVLENGAAKEYHARTDVKIDKQRPTIYTEEVNVSQGDSWTGTHKDVTFTMSDGNGSGIYGYSVSLDSDCTRARYTKTSRQTVSEAKSNGTYYICVKDQAGNISEDVSTKTVVVSKIDTTPPQGVSLKVSSSVSAYHHYEVNLDISATDESMLSMYISNTGFLENGTWERYTPTKAWNVFTNTSLASSPRLDGSSHTIYVTIRDEVGNSVNISNPTPYVLYHECSSEVTKNYLTDWGSCSASCGGGLQYRQYEIRDNKTNIRCSAGSENRACNQQPCERPDDYNWSKEVTCDASKLQSVIDSGKFKSFIEYSAFRNAMYDCASTSESVIRRSSKAIQDLRSSSRYVLAFTKGKKSKTCKESCPSNCEKDCKNPPACSDVYDWYPNAISSVYSGKALVISVSANGRPCMGVVSRCNDTCEYDGWCDMDNDTGYLTQSGEILIGQLDGKKETTATWYTVKSDYKTGDADNVIKFLNNFGATTIQYYDRSEYDNCRWDYRTIWRTDNIAIQYFMI